VDGGLRPSASETSRPAPANFPLGDDQENSSNLFVFTLCIFFLDDIFLPDAISIRAQEQRAA
jgi:hypothetical protein